MYGKKVSILLFCWQEESLFEAFTTLMRTLNKDAKTRFSKTF